MSKAYVNTATKDNWDFLKAAVLQYACEDYVNAVNGYLHPAECPRQRGYNAGDALKDLKKFFLSSWFTAFSDIDPDYLMRGLDEKARQQKGKKLRSLVKEGKEAAA